MSSRSALGSFLGFVLVILLVIVLLMAFGVMSCTRTEDSLDIKVNTDTIEEAGERAVQETGEGLEKAGEQLQGQSNDTKTPD